MFELVRTWMTVLLLFAHTRLTSAETWTARCNNAQFNFDRSTGVVNLYFNTTIGYLKMAEGTIVHDDGTVLRAPLDGNGVGGYNGLSLTEIELDASQNRVNVQYRNPSTGTISTGIFCSTLISSPQRTPTHKPSNLKPTRKPSRQPTRKPTRKPSRKPTRKPSIRKPTRKPSRKPTRRPSVRKPTRRPSRKPTRKPSRKPTRKPSRRPTTTPTLDVIIIGAGWAGLGAAKTLLSKNKTKFVVLEARNYIGGRSRTVTMSDGITSVDLGSSWVHGVTNNPVQAAVTSLKQGYQMIADTQGYWSNDFSTAPGRIPASTMNTFINTYWDGSGGFFPYQEGRQCTDNTDTSLRNVANDYISQKGISSGSNRNAFEFLLDTYIMQEYAASVEDLSLYWWDDDSELTGGDSYLAINQTSGYGPLVESFAANFSSTKIFLNCVVTAVNYTISNAVRVSYTENGILKQLVAKKVIVTVPLGVLKNSSIKFTPSLPSSTQTAISKLGMGLMNKVVLRWPQATTLPWPSDIEWVERIQPLAKKGQWQEFYNPTGLNGGRNMIIAFTVGREAARVQNLTDVEAMTEALTSLREIFGQNNVPDPTEYLVTRWGSDPYSLGSYSYLPVGSNPQHRVNLGQSVNNMLFFAGEATHSKYPSTTHGALMSGNTAATTVAGLI